MVTVSSGAIVIQALISGTVASRYQGWAATGALAAAALGGIQKPMTIAPPTAAVVVRNSRRSMSFLFSLIMASFTGCALPGLHSLRSCLTTQRGCAMDGLPDAMIGSAPASIGHLSIDVGVRGLRLLFEQRHRGQDLPGLAVAALRNVELLPGKLDRMRTVSRQSFNGGDLSADSA